MKPSRYVYGLHAVQHALDDQPEQVLELWTLANDGNRDLSAITERARRQGIAVQPVARRQLDRMTENARHQGVVLRIRAVCEQDEALLQAILERRDPPPFLLVLDEVQDPHNLGACLRSADGAGVDAVLIPSHRAAGLTATVMKVASGAASSVPLIRAGNLARSLERLHAAGIRCVGTAGEAPRSLYATDLRGPLAIILGGEERGLRRLTREHCDALVSIPMRGQVESLNISVCAGICLYEALRQRQP
ncbi:MAG: 23S rRNA (guanosine(2251)-2'-O)-methyltransferase RlmB [Gammaproteobacteria bacterium]